MTNLKLNDDRHFAIERHEKRARLIVYKGSVENVCRKESFKNLVSFVQSDDKYLFKGRLQLHKNPAGIEVIVKGKSAGTIKADEFINHLEMVKNQD